MTKSNQLQQAAQKRASQIRTLRGIRVGLIWDPKDRQEMVNIIDRQLAAMGAETTTERTQRYRQLDYSPPRTDKEWDDLYNKTGKPYKMKPEDVKKYTMW